jgi:hypothetical protein
MLLYWGKMESVILPHFEQPAVNSGFSIGRAAVVRDPATNRRVLFEHCDNHEKGWPERRGLSARFTSGLLRVEGHNCCTFYSKII